MTADDATNEAMNVGGTRNALELADALEVGLLPPGLLGRRRGRVPRHASTRRCSTRASTCPRRTTARSSSPRGSSARRPRSRGGSTGPSIVVGHSETGAMDKVDGPYYFFPVMKALRDNLPAWLPLVGVDLGDTNVVPGRLRRQGDGPPRAPARPRRRGVPPGQPRPAAGRRHGQLVLHGGRRADVRHPDRPPASPPPGRWRWSPARLRPLARRSTALRQGSARCRPCST